MKIRGRSNDDFSTQTFFSSPFAAAVVTVLGVAIASGVQFQGLKLQIEAIATSAETDRAAERDQKLRELRRPIYLEFLDASNAYATAQAVRGLECQPRKDLPLIAGDRCTVTLLGDLQAARYRLQGAINELSTVESSAANRVASDVAGSMPPTLVGAGGAPNEGVVDQKQLTAGIARFIAVMKCDTSPVPDESCS